jgi:hypothetical protein
MKQTTVTSLSTADPGMLRIGALAGLLGLVTQLVASGLHPGHAQPNDSAAAFLEYASSNIWTAVHIGQFAGGLLVALAFVVLAVSLPKQGASGGFAVIGGAAAVVVGAVFAVQMAVDGVALKGAISTWLSVSASERTAAFMVAEAIRDLEKGLSGFFHLMNGTTMLALGVALLSGRMYPRWIGAFGVVAGIGFISGGVVTAHVGFAPEAGTILSPALLAGLVFLVSAAVAMLRVGRRSGDARRLGVAVAAAPNA